MPKWNDHSFIIRNRDETYRDFFNRTGEDSVRHYALTILADPALESYLRETSIIQHVYETGDTLSKIAFKYYGDPLVWWVLAWFNGKPTDFHCTIGDVINVPLPLEDAITHALSVEIM